MFLKLVENIIKDLFVLGEYMLKWIEINFISGTLMLIIKPVGNIIINILEFLVSTIKLIIGKL